MRTLRWVLVVMVASFASSAAAQARVAVAVSAFSGVAASGVRDSVLEALASDARVTVVQDGSSARVVIEGAVGGRAARRRVTLTAHDASGRAIGTARARLRGAAGARALASAVTSLLDGALASLPGESTGDAGGRAGGTETAPPAAHSGAPPSASTSASTSLCGDDPAFLTIALTGALRSREAVVTLLDESTRGYGASPYFELGGRVELRPLAHEQSYARGLYAYVEAAGAIALSSHRPDGTSVATSFYRLAGTLGYLVPIDRALELGAGVGGGWDAFQLANNQWMPTVEYPYLRASVRVRARVLGELLVLGAEAGYRGLFGREGLSSAFGMRGDSFGWDVSGSISGTLDFGLFYGLEAGYTQYVHAFDGTGGFLAEATRGTDGGYRVTLLAGYALR